MAREAIRAFWDNIFQLYSKLEPEVHAVHTCGNEAAVVLTMQAQTGDAGAANDAVDVIEVDGDTHASNEDRLQDTRRDEILARKGYRVLRFWNSEVRESVDGVVQRILSALDDRPPP